MKKIAPRIGVLNAPELASKYPVIGHRDALESIIKDIGVGIIKVTMLPLGLPGSVEKPFLR